MPPKKAKKPEGTKMGKIVFKARLSAQQKKLVQKLQKSININGFRWQLVNGLFLECNVRQLLEYVQELNINHLGLTNNQYPNIIYDLVVFNPYDKLQNLIMPDNFIQSLEPINYINAPLLWRIDFGRNLIRDMRSFRRMHCPKLVMFRIGNNKISELGQFEYCYCPELMEITIQGNQNFTCINPLIKLQSPQFRQIYGHTSGIINIKKLFKTFRKRNKQINLAID